MTPDKIMEEILPTEDDLKKVGDHYWGGDYEPTYIELTRLKASFAEILTPKIATTLTQLVKEVEAGERETLRVHIEREVIDPMLDETKTFGQAKIINTLRDTLRATTPPTSDVIDK